MNLALPESVKFWSQLIHPAIMWVLLALSIYALYLGIQVQRTRYAEGDLKKELIKGRHNVKHYQIGSVLLALMVIVTIVGMAVTYMINGKLFVSAHLLAGLGMTALIATSAALSPFMQKGMMWARYSHIALNVVLLGLFGWQAVTGMQIVLKIVSQT